MGLGKRPQGLVDIGAQPDFGFQHPAAQGEDLSDLCPFDLTLREGHSRFHHGKGEGLNAVAIERQVLHIKPVHHTFGLSGAAPG